MTLPTPGARCRAGLARRAQPAPGDRRRARPRGAGARVADVSGGLHRPRRRRPRRRGVGALRGADVRATSTCPLVPVIVGGTAMFAAAYESGSDGLVVALALSVARRARLAALRRRRRLSPRRVGGVVRPVLPPAAGRLRRPHGHAVRTVPSGSSRSSSSWSPATSAATSWASCSASTRWRPRISPEEVLGGLRRLGPLLLRRRCRGAARPARRAVVAGSAARTGRGVHARSSATCASRWSSATSASRTWGRCCPVTAA